MGECAKVQNSLYKLSVLTTLGVTVVVEAMENA